MSPGSASSSPSACPCPPEASPRAGPAPALEPFWRLVFPESCVACGVPLERPRRHFCAACYRALPWIGEPACPRCGHAVGPHARAEAGCAACRNRRFAFARAVAPLRYEGAARELILKFKLGRRAPLAHALGAVLGDFLAESGLSRAADLVAPVPLHWRRRLSRGFNQAMLLARELALRFGLPLAPRLLVRRRATETQTTLSGPRRGANVRGAFAVRAARIGGPLARLAGRSALLGRRVLVVDDVFTTGATVHECARVLREGGAAEVLVATVARTPHASG